jgi:hypothetical protein
VDDLALLLGGFVQFCRLVILEPALEILQNFAGGFSCGANDEDASEFAFVFLIAFGERLFDGLGAVGVAALFPRGPRPRPRGGRGMTARFADARM